MGNYGLGDVCWSAIVIEVNVVFLYIDAWVDVEDSLQGGMDKY